MLFKLVIILLLLIVLVSLFSGLAFMNHSSGAKRGDPRTVRALTVRIAASLLLFGALLIAYHLGWLGRAS